MSHNSSNINNEQSDAPQENGFESDRSRHCTKFQLSVQVNQLADTVNQLQTQQQSFQQQLLSQ